jgi:hypothetical protein
MAMWSVSSWQIKECNDRFYEKNALATSICSMNWER